MTQPSVLHEFVYACTAEDPEPQLWPLAYLDTLIAAYQELREQYDELRDEEDEDRSATYEMLQECRTMRDRLYAALKQAGYDKDARPERSPQPAADGRDIPF